jgi:coenzyme F420-reducing hydrogenase alpha subunit
MSDTNSEMRNQYHGAGQPSVCKHGQIARSCGMCELAYDLASMTAERDALLQEIKDCHQHVAFLKRLMANGRF